VAILRRHLIDKVPVSDLCDQYRLNATVFYNWQKLFFENGAAAFERKSGTRRGETVKDRKIDQLEEKVRAKNEVIAELMEENVKAKKANGEL